MRSARFSQRAHQRRLGCTTRKGVGVGSRDFESLASLIAIPIEAGSESQTGRLAKAIDAWTANELRRAGFDADEVWPRLTKPRVLPRTSRSTSVGYRQRNEWQLRRGC